MLEKARTVQHVEEEVPGDLSNKYKKVQVKIMESDSVTFSDRARHNEHKLKQNSI